LLIFHTLRILPKCCAYLLNLGNRFILAKSQNHSNIPSMGSGQAVHACALENRNRPQDFFLETGDGQPKSG
jgi:hypothetical protein